MLGIVAEGAYHGRFSALAYEEVPEPALPNEHWVKIRTALCGICSSDLTTIFLKGNLDSPLTPFVSFPMILGHEIVGEIVEIGRAVEDLAPGDRVVVDPLLSCRTRDIAPLCPSCREGHHALCENFAKGSLPAGLLLGANSGVGGGFAPIVVAHKTQCLKILDRIPFEEAVLTDPFAVVLHALLSHPPQESDPVLIVGGGTLGLSAVQAMKALYPGSQILVVAKYDFQRDLALRFGADLALSSQDRDGIYRGVARLTGARVYNPFWGKPILMGGVGVVYDCVGSAASIEYGLRLARARGRVVVIGVGRPKRFEWSPLWFKEISLVGSLSVGLEYDHGRRRHTYQIALDLILEKKVNLKPLLTHTFQLPHYREAIRTCTNKGRSKAIKVAFSF